MRATRSATFGRAMTMRVGLLAVLAVLGAAPAAQAIPGAAVGHAYRHGVVPKRGSSTAGPTVAPTGNPAKDLAYGCGISSVGVTTGAPKVYLVFWGSQWGTQGSNANSDVTLSGDSSGVAPRVQEFFKGLGTNGETWSGVMTQYCEGVASGSKTCPSAASHVGYPTGGALAGVWVDESAAAPSAATAHAIGAEAVKAATHFANTTQALNRNTQYVIISPHGTNPDGWETGGFCAWHDYTGDSTLDGGGAVSSPDGLLAFTNLPYVTDAGAS